MNNIKIYTPKININKNIKEDSIKSEDQVIIKSNKKLFEDENNTFTNSQKIDNIPKEKNNQSNNTKKNNGRIINI